MAFLMASMAVTARTAEEERNVAELQRKMTEAENMASKVWTHIQSRDAIHQARIANQEANRGAKLRGEPSPTMEDAPEYVPPLPWRNYKLTQDLAYYRNDLMRTANELMGLA